MTAAVAARAVDLRRAPLAEVRALDLRDPDRDLWADEAAVWDRLLATWAGLDDAAWRLPGAARSDAGGPDWSLAEHVGHLVAWQDLAVDYTAVALETGRWPDDADYDGGDFDTYNERLRQPWATMARDEIIRAAGASRERLLTAVAPLEPAVIRSDAAWGWLYMALHGHHLDHLAIIEPWTATLRLRQIDGDPFVADPRAADHAAFRREVMAAATDLDDLLRQVPMARWSSVTITPGWSIRDHVAHLADWFAEGARAIEVYHWERIWLPDPEEGVDAWNERHVEDGRDEDAPATRARYERSMAAMLDAVAGLTIDELRSPDGWSWAYDCLQGHLRKHAALLGPRCLIEAWPTEPPSA